MILRISATYSAPASLEPDFPLEPVYLLNTSIVIGEREAVLPQTLRHLLGLFLVEVLLIIFFEDRAYILKEVFFSIGFVDRVQTGTVVKIFVGAKGTVSHSGDDKTEWVFRRVFSLCIFKVGSIFIQSARG